jgi:hypothetical protein
MTLAPLGLLIEPEAENLITESDITQSQWIKVGLAATSTNSVFANPIYMISAYGVNRTHYTRLPIPTVNYDTYRTVSIYMKNANNRYAQIALGGEIVNYDLV